LMSRTQLTVACAVLSALLLIAAARADEHDTETEHEHDSEFSFGELAADARFPMTPKFERFASGCMDVNRAICLGNPKKNQSPHGLFAVTKAGHQKGLIGYWTFDDALCQDHSGNMDPLYPTPSFGPGMNGGTSAHFNGSSLHWISPARTRPHSALNKRSKAERDLAANKAKAKADKKKHKKKHKHGHKKKKRAPGIAMTDTAEAAIALSTTPAGHGEVHDFDDLTIAFWVYLLNDVVGKFRTLVYRGDAEAATPHISLWPEVRRIHLRASTGMDLVTGKRTHITLDSHSAVLIGRWTHIAFVVQGTRLAQLYVNGVLDTQKLSLQPIKIHHSSDMVYLANNPFQPNSGMECYMDSLLIYNRALPHGQVTAMGSVVLPGLDASSVKMGCASCTLERAVSACKGNRAAHVCTKTQLHSGALVIARAMGWMNSMVGVHVFSQEELTHKPKRSDTSKADTASNSGDADAVVLGVGLCCRDT